MDEQFRQYRFARTEGQKITEVELATQFKDGIKDLHQLEHAIEQLLTKQAAPLAHHRSGARRLFREGIRAAAVEFYWNNRQQVRRLILDQPPRPG